MAVKRSEDYLYFQNKAHHYRNIHEMKPSIEDQLPHRLRQTLDHSRLQDRDCPYNRKHQISVENKQQTQRIMSIVETARSEVQASGGYARYNKFERSFRKRNPHKDEQERNISLQNEKFRYKIEKMRPKVGENSVWQAEFRDNDKYRRLRCKYEEGRKSKCELKISETPFLADPYLQLLNQLDRSRSAKRLHESKEPIRRPKHVKLEHDKLFILPCFDAPKQS